MTKPSEILDKCLLSDNGVARKLKTEQIIDQMAEDIDRLKGMVTGLYLKNAFEGHNTVNMTALFPKREWEI